MNRARASFVLHVATVGTRYDLSTTTADRHDRVVSDNSRFSSDECAGASSLAGMLVVESLDRVDHDFRVAQSFRSDRSDRVFIASLDWSSCGATTTAVERAAN